MQSEILFILSICNHYTIHLEFPIFSADLRLLLISPHTKLPKAAYFKWDYNFTKRNLKITFHVCNNIKFVFSCAVSPWDYHYFPLPCGNSHLICIQVVYWARFSISYLNSRELIPIYHCSKDYQIIDQAVPQVFVATSKGKKNDITLQKKWKITRQLHVGNKKNDFVRKAV